MIDTYSSFYYGFTVTAQPYNGSINIDEGSGEILVQVPVGSYTMSDLASTIQNALNTQAVNNYQVTLNRNQRLFIISSDDPFDILTDTGSNADSAIYDLIGFSTALDKTGQTSYSGDFPSGKVYKTQFPLQSYVSKDDFQQGNLATKNVASDGTTVEVVRFGLAKFIEMDIKFITSRNDIADGNVIKKNNRGLEDAREFLQFITRLNPFEFMPDLNQAGDFEKVVLENYPGFNDGTGYRLRELFGQNLRDVYETGIIRLRVLEN